MHAIFTASLALILSLSAPETPAYDQLPAFTVQIYPNPSQDGRFYVQLEEVNSPGPITLRVTDLIGKEYFLKQVSPHAGQAAASILLTGLPHGVYLLEVSRGDSHQIHRLSYI